MCSWCWVSIVPIALRILYQIEEFLKTLENNFTIFNRQKSFLTSSDVIIPPLSLSRKLLIITQLRFEIFENSFCMSSDLSNLLQIVSLTYFYAQENWRGGAFGFSMSQRGKTNKWEVHLRRCRCQKKKKISIQQKVFSALTFSCKVIVWFISIRPRSH